MTMLCPKKKSPTSVHMPCVLLLLCVYREKDSEKNGDAYKNGHRDLSGTTKQTNKSKNKTKQKTKNTSELDGTEVIHGSISTQHDSTS